MKERLLKALQDYEEREFGETSHNSIDDIKNIIPIAYTTVGDDEQYEIQVNFNLEKLQWEEYINGELKHTDKRDSIESFISELESCEFDDIIRDIYAIALDMEEEEKPKVCPRCGKEYSEEPALSRVDNETEICPDCGMAEALEAMF